MNAATVPSRPAPAGVRTGVDLPRLWQLPGKVTFPAGRVLSSPPSLHACSVQHRLHALAHPRSRFGYSLPDRTQNPQHLVRPHCCYRQISDHRQGVRLQRSQPLGRVLCVSPDRTACCPPVRLPRRGMFARPASISALYLGRLRRLSLSRRVPDRPAAVPEPRRPATRAFASGTPAGGSPTGSRPISRALPRRV